MPALNWVLKDDTVYNENCPWEVSGAVGKCFMALFVLYNGVAISQHLVDYGEENKLKTEKVKNKNKKGPRDAGFLNWEGMQELELRAILLFIYDLTIKTKSLSENYLLDILIFIDN